MTEKKKEHTEKAAGHPHSKVVEEGKAIAVIAYLTWVGLLVAFIMNTEKKNAFAKFHIRQSLILTIAGIVGMFIFWLPIIGWALGLALLVLWIMGLIYAINGQEKLVPILGKYGQEWFKGL